MLLVQHTEASHAESAAAAVSARPEAFASTVRWFFAFFVASGFCGLVYQVVWLRMAMAAFGVTTPLVSIVLSVFMGGLALGSWAGGRLARRLAARPASAFVALYAASELVIGLSGVLVVPLFSAERNLLASLGGPVSWASSSYYFASGALIAATLLPFCTAMGATIPLAMAAIAAMRRAAPAEASRSFSYLYLANVAGALAGTLVSAFVLIEWLGFRGTMYCAAALNALVAAAALTMRRRADGIDAPAMAAAPFAPPAASAPSAAAAGAHPQPLIRTILFVTGLVSLAMEVAWTRMFVPYQGTFVYSFATILAVYLAATTLGSRFYRARASRLAPDAMRDDGRLALLAAAAASLLALVAIDPRLPLESGALRVVLGVAPVSAVLGFLTPFLMDRWAAGDPRRAGAAYALNTAGCIIGPILAGFVMLPAMSERITMIVLAAPLFALGFAGARTDRRWTIAAFGLLVAALLAIVLTKDFTSRLPGAVLRRDHTATVVAAGKGMNKAMFVNGSSITNLTPITKLMAHLPLAFHSGEPRRGLVLCFGMGTSFRSMMSWGIEVTAVELVPSVPSLFSYYHADADAVLGSPRARVVIDDARRFLERSSESFDVITIDPPPPVAAAGSSLLYSREFYHTAKRRLAPGGILQQWLPHGEPILWSAVTKALEASFEHVRVLVSIEGWGCHFLASDSPIPDRSGLELAARLPEAARADLIEWGPASSVEEQLQNAIAREHTPGNLTALDPGAPVLSDNRPVNEYFFLRRTFSGSKTMGE